MDEKDNRGHLLDIVYQVGTFGMFLRWFIDKYSILTPEVSKDPFTSIGTAHREVPWSGKVWCGKPHELKREGTQRPLCFVVPSTWKHFLFLASAVWYRGDDKKNAPDDLYKKAIGEQHEDLRPAVDSIMDLYNIKDRSHFTWLQKFIVRDWYKLSFLEDIRKNHHYQTTQTIIKDKFMNSQDLFLLDMETFFNWQTFVPNIKKLDQHFNLEIDWERIKEMQKDFMKGYDRDTIRQECNYVIDVLENGSDESLDKLSVVAEAYVSAHFEKLNPEIQMPLTNRFFRDLEEINRYIEHYPHWYRRKNPNLSQK